MRAVLRTAAGLAVVAAAVGGSMVGGMVLGGAADATSSLDGYSVTRPVAVDPLTLWYAHLDPDGVCDLLPGCVAGRGSARDWTFTLVLVAEDGSLVAEDVAATVTRSDPGRRIVLRLSASSDVGDLSGEVSLSLVPVGRDRTRLTVTVDRMQAVGLTGAVVPGIRDSLDAAVSSAARSIGVTAALADARVTATAARRGRGGRAVVRVRVSARGDDGSRATASGRVLLFRGSSRLPARVVPLRHARGASARVRLRGDGDRPPIRVVLVGRLDNGLPVMASGRARWRR